MCALIPVILFAVSGIFLVLVCLATTLAWVGYSALQCHGCVFIFLLHLKESFQSLL